MLQKTKSKKGFTLAELLIVVAIIAVLTAIAVPLFVGALNKAEDKVGAANCSAVRGLATTQILINETAVDIGKTYTDGNAYFAYADVDANGTVTKLQYSKGTDLADAASKATQKGDWKLKDTESATAVGTNGWYLKDNGGYQVAVKIELSTVAS